MNCRGSVREVTARLRDVPGETVTANPSDSLVRAAGQMEVADVLPAFTDTTYRPKSSAGEASTAVEQRSNSQRRERGATARPRLLRHHRRARHVPCDFY